jgi:tetratricopeptide (TPR) repeat protein
MTASHREWNLTRRALAVLGLMVLVVGASQLLAASRAIPARPPAAAPAAVPGADAPTVQVLDGGDALTPSTAADLGRVQADVAFWSGRLERHPGDFVSAEKWGESEVDLARATGDVTAYLRAGAAFDVALRLYPGMPAANAFKGAVLVSLHKFSDAVGLARASLAETPNDPTALATLGDASLELGDVASARNAFERLASMAPSAAADARLSHLAFITGDTESAIRVARAAVAASDEEDATGERAAFYRYQLAETLIGSGDRAGAEEAYRDALASDPGSFLAHAGLAHALAAAGDLAGAIGELSAAIAIVPLPESLARRGDLYALRNGSGDAARAKKDYDLVAFEAGLAGEAAYLYDRTLVLYLANHGIDADRAVSLAQSELAVRKDVYGYDALAWAQLAAGRPADADKTMMNALAFGTRDARLEYHAAMIALALRDTGRARSGLEAALALDPGFDPFQASRARRALADLP